MITVVIFRFTFVIDARTIGFMETIKSELPSISDSEWEVINLLWKNSPLSAHQIIESLDRKEWSPKTVKTLIHRLQKKGAIDFKKDRREYLYFPLIEKSNYVKKESQNLLEKLFGGAAAPMVTHFIENKKMSKDELSQIKQLIEQMEGETK